MNFKKAVNHKNVLQIEDPKFIEFLSGYGIKTQMTYATCIRKLYLFEPNISGEKMLSEHDLWERNKIFQLRKWLIEEQKVGDHFAVSTVATVCSFFAHNRVPLKLLPQENKRLRKKANKEKRIFMSKPDLAKLWNVADLEGKWVLSNKTFGYRQEDYVAITWKNLRCIDFQNGEVPYEFGTFPSIKAGTEYHSYIDADVAEVIKQLLEVNKDKADGDRVFNKAPREMNYILKVLAEKVQLPYTPTMHTLRRFLFDRLCNNMAEIKANYVVGHAVAGNVNKAYASEEMRESFKKTLPEISVNGNSKNHEAIEELNKKLEERDKLVAQQNLAIEELKAKLNIAETLGAQNQTSIQSLIATVEDLKKKVEARDKT